MSLGLQKPPSLMSKALAALNKNNVATSAPVQDSSAMSGSTSSVTLDEKSIADALTKSTQEMFAQLSKAANSYVQLTSDNIQNMRQDSGSTNLSVGSGSNDLSAQQNLSLFSSSGAAKSADWMAANASYSSSGWPHFPVI